MARVRVLFVEASAGGVVGGSLTGLIHLIRGLDRSRVEPGIVLYERKGIEAELESLGVSVHHVARRRVPKEHGLLRFEGYHRAKRSRGVAGMLRTLRQTVRLAIEEGPTAWQLARVIRAFRPDVVHLGNGVRANFDGLLACRLTRTPVLCHVKGFEKYSSRERRAARRIDVLVPMTKAVEEHCRRHGIVGRRTAVVYDALDETAFVPGRSPVEVRRELGVPSEAPLFGVAGNVQEWKGQAVLVEAMPRILASVPGAHALIIGGVHRSGAAYHDRLRARIRELGIEAAVHVTGFRNDMPDVFQALDVVVHTSVRPEPFGRVILEGMLLGKPVVATDAGGVPELIENGRTGFLTPPGDPVALADTLVPLLLDPDRRAGVGSAAQAWARDRFRLPRHVAEMTAIYESIREGR